MCRNYKKAAARKRKREEAKSRGPPAVAQSGAGTPGRFRKIHNSKKHSGGRARQPRTRPRWAPYTCRPAGPRRPCRRKVKRGPGAGGRRGDGQELAAVLAPRTCSAFQSSAVANIQPTSRPVRRSPPAPVRSYLRPFARTTSSFACVRDRYRCAARACASPRMHGRADGNGSRAGPTSRRTIKLFSLY